MADQVSEQDRVSEHVERLLELRRHADAGTPRLASAYRDELLVTVCDPRVVDALVVEVLEARTQSQLLLNGDALPAGKRGPYRA